MLAGRCQKYAKWFWRVKAVAGGNAKDVCTENPVDLLSEYKG